MKKQTEALKEMGATPFMLYTILILNSLRALDVTVGLLAVIAWIITKDHTFGYVLGGTIVAYFVMNIIISFVGMRLVTKNIRD